MSLNDFELGKNLGKGAFASVILVTRKADRKIYAMKRINIAKMDKSEREAALNEIRILASLSHPNIIGYKEAFFDEMSRTLNIVMEYADDGDIDKKIKDNLKKRNLFSEETIWNWVIQILEGLKYLHDNKIMHRDLKCANLFLMKNGLLKLGDLNVSKIAKMGIAQTQTGTPYYISPEIWEEKPYDYKCDIWSVGCIIYEMCTLRPPFRGTSLKELYRNIKNGYYIPISNNYSKDIRDIISMMLVIDSKKRASAEELLNSNIIKKWIKIIKGENFDNEIGSSNMNNIKANLIRTIKMPKNLGDINQYLPKKRYNPEEEMMKNDKYEIMKETMKKVSNGNNKINNNKMDLSWLNEDDNRYNRNYKINNRMNNNNNYYRDNNQNYQNYNYQNNNNNNYKNNNYNYQNNRNNYYNNNRQHTPNIGKYNYLNKYDNNMRLIHKEEENNNGNNINYDLRRNNNKYNNNNYNNNNYDYNYNNKNQYNYKNDNNYRNNYEKERKNYGENRYNNIYNYKRNYENNNYANNKYENNMNYIINNNNYIENKYKNEEKNLTPNKYLYRNNERNYNNNNNYNYNNYNYNNRTPNRYSNNKNEYNNNNYYNYNYKKENYNYNQYRPQYNNNQNNRNDNSYLKKEKVSDKNYNNYNYNNKKANRYKYIFADEDENEKDKIDFDYFDKKDNQQQYNPPQNHYKNNNYRNFNNDRKDIGPRYNLYDFRYNDYNNNNNNYNKPKENDEIKIIYQKINYNKMMKLKLYIKK